MFSQKKEELGFEAKSAPEVSFSPQPEDEGCLWTLLAVNPDGNPVEAGKSILHWLLVNIPADGDLSRADELKPYLPPLPFQGTGFHRLVFTLFRQVRLLEPRLERVVCQYLSLPTGATH